MMNKIISTFLKILLLLEIRIRGQHIKKNTWRVKLSKSQYFKDLFPIFGDHIRFYVKEPQKIAYLNMNKVASSSLIYSLFESEELRAEHFLVYEKRKKENLNMNIDHLIFKAENQAFFPINIKGIQRKNRGWQLSGRNPKKNFEFEHKAITLEDVNSFFIFTFVRNPFPRFVSFFQYVYSYSKRNKTYHSWRKTFFWLSKVLSFEELVLKVSKLPDFHLDRHAYSQFSRIKDYKTKGVKIDFIGKFETLQQDFEPLKQRFGLLPLEHHNKSTGEKENWRDYYTPKTAKMIYQRYRKDFEMLGYEDEYPKLLDYLASQKVSKINDQ